MTKWTESMRINAAINRAVRRGRITRTQALNLMHSWVLHLARRPRAVKYRCWAADMLNHAAAARRSGSKILARHMLADAHFAITMSSKP